MGKEIHAERQGRLGIERITVELARLGHRHSAKGSAGWLGRGRAQLSASQALHGHHGPRRGRRRRLGGPRGPAPGSRPYSSTSVDPQRAVELRAVQGKLALAPAWTSWRSGRAPLGDFGPVPRPFER
jgi:hypothetical protein